MFPELLLLYEIPPCPWIILTTFAYSSGSSVHLNTKVNHKCIFLYIIRTVLEYQYFSSFGECYVDLNNQIITVKYLF